MKVTEIHGVAGQYEYRIERDPVWIEVSPESIAIAQARLEQRNGHP